MQYILASLDSEVMETLLGTNDAVPNGTRGAP